MLLYLLKALNTELRQQHACHGALSCFSPSQRIEEKNFPLLKIRIKYYTVHILKWKSIKIVRRLVKHQTQIYKKFNFHSSLSLFRSFKYCFKFVPLKIRYKCSPKGRGKKILSFLLWLRFVWYENTKKFSKLKLELWAHSQNFLSPYLCLQP